MGPSHQQRPHRLSLRGAQRDGIGPHVVGWRIGHFDGEGQSPVADSPHSFSLDPRELSFYLRGLSYYFRKRIGNVEA